MSVLATVGDKSIRACTALGAGCGRERDDVDDWAVTVVVVGFGFETTSISESDGVTRCAEMVVPLLPELPATAAGLLASTALGCTEGLSSKSVIS